MTNYREILRLHSLGLNKTEIAASAYTGPVVQAFRRPWCTLSAEDGALVPFPVVHGGRRRWCTAAMLGLSLRIMCFRLLNYEKLSVVQQWQPAYAWSRLQS